MSAENSNCIANRTRSKRQPNVKEQTPASNRKASGVAAARVAAARAQREAVQAKRGPQHQQQHSRKHGRSSMHQSEAQEEGTPVKAKPMPALAPQQQDELAMQQLRMLLGPVDGLPASDEKFLAVMRVVAPWWGLGLAINQVAEAYDARAQLAERWTASNEVGAAVGNPGTPPLRRALMRYLGNCARGLVAASR